MTLRPPSALTLRKYGLTLVLWLELAKRQNHVCAVCRKLPKTGLLNIDHEHVKGWKKMLPEERVKWVRGLLCHWCNRTYCSRGITVERAQNVITYLSQTRPFG
jgi:hypothetical protein